MKLCFERMNNLGKINKNADLTRCNSVSHLRSRRRTRSVNDVGSFCASCNNAYTVHVKLVIWCKVFKIRSAHFCAYKNGQRKETCARVIKIINRTAAARKIVLWWLVCRTREKCQHCGTAWTCGRQADRSEVARNTAVEDHHLRQRVPLPAELEF